MHFLKTFTIYFDFTKRFLVEFYYFFPLLLCVFCSVSIIAAHRGGHGFVTAIYIHLLTKCVLTLIRPASVRRFY